MFKKAESSDINNDDEWLLGYSYYISKLYLNLDKIAFYAVNTFFPIKKVDDDGLFVLAYALGDAHPAAIEFEENAKMIKHYNDNVTSKKAFLYMFPAKRELNRKTFTYIKRKYQRST